MTRQALTQLREHEDRELRLEFFFYTNKSANAEALNSKLVPANLRAIPPYS
jgi:hypothetical protein